MPRVQCGCNDSLRMFTKTPLSRAVGCCGLMCTGCHECIIAGRAHHSRSHCGTHIACTRESPREVDEQDDNMDAADDKSDNKDEDQSNRCVPQTKNVSRHHILRPA
jgi:hypothetical protein